MSNKLLRIVVSKNRSEPEFQTSPLKTLKISVNTIIDNYRKLFFNKSSSGCSVEHKTTCFFQELYHHFFSYCCAKGICLPPGSNLINVNDKERKSLKVSTSLGTLPNAQYCHFNDMITAHKMTTKL